MVLSRKQKLASFYSNCVNYIKDWFTKLAALSRQGEKRKKKKINQTQLSIPLWALPSYQSQLDEHTIAGWSRKYTILWSFFLQEKWFSGILFCTSLWCVTVPLIEWPLPKEYLVFQCFILCGLTAVQYLGQIIDRLTSEGEANSCLQQQFPVFKREIKGFIY